jgi:hypothetical protein
VLVPAVRVLLAGLATAMLVLAAAGAAQARERVATMQDDELALTGERVVWPVYEPRVPGHVSGVRIVIAAPGEQPRTLATFPPVKLDQPGGGQNVEIEASGTHLAVARGVVGITPHGRYSTRNTVLLDEMWAGPIGGELERIASCETGDEVQAMPFDFDISGARVVRQSCDRGRTVVVRDLELDIDRPVVRGGADGHGVSLAGRYLAWEERADTRADDRTLVVHDLDTASDVYRVDQPRQWNTIHKDFYVQEDGKLLDPHIEVPNDPVRRSHWFSPAEPFAHDFARTGTYGLFRDRTLGVHAYGELHDLTVHGLDGSYSQIARMTQNALAAHDFDGERVAWAERRCGATTIYTQRVGEPLSVSRSTLEGRCAKASVPGSASVARGGRVRLPVRCRRMSVCAGTVRLRDEAGTTLAKTRFAFPRRRSLGIVPLRLRTVPGSVTVLVTDRNGLILAERKLTLRR